MANTGYVIVTERDVNPHSPTYNTTRRIKYQDLSRCPTNTEPVWTLTTSYCEQNNGHNTGNLIKVMTDTNPASATYMQTTTSTEQYSGCVDFASGNKIYVEEIRYGTNRSHPCDGNSHIDNTQVLKQPNDYFMVIGDCVSVIDDYFHNNPGTGGNGLIDLYLPDTITSIGYKAFFKVDCLDNVYIHAITPPTLGTGAFRINESYAVIQANYYVPAQSVDAYKAAWPSFSSFIHPME